MHRPPEPDDDAIAQEAAAWVARRDRGLAPAEAAMLCAWARRDPRHAAALDELDGAWRSLNGIATDPVLTALADEVVARARARRARRRMQFSFGTLAAAAAVAVAFVVLRREPSAVVPLSLPDNVQVIASTLRRVTLADGSVAELNGGSRIEPTFTASERRVRLLEGEAHFIVVPNPQRPFSVTVGTITVRAVGTAFNVRLTSAGEIEVLVTEGTVRLESLPPPAAAPAATAAPTPAPAGDAPALVAGQRARIGRATGAEAQPAAVAIGAVGRDEIQEALGWQGTRFAFNATPLHEVVAAFNRHNRHQLALGDPALRRRTLTGVFRADNLDGFVRLLRASVDVKAELRTPAETVLLPAR